MKKNHLTQNYLEIPPFASLNRNDELLWGGGVENSGGCAAAVFHPLRYKCRSFRTQRSGVRNLVLVLAICAGIAFSANAQNIRITGKVAASNGTGIAGVHIFDSIAKVGATSDINGIFTLTIPPKATKLRFSHLAFETKYLSLTQKRLADTIAVNTIWLDVVLTQKTRELPAFEISDAKVEIAYKNSKQWILDYEPVGTDEFLLLLLEKNKKYLQLVNSNHEKISQIVVNKDYSTLFKDRFGFFYVLSKDSACQIFLVEEDLRLFYHHTRNDFERWVEPVVVNTDNYLYTKDDATAYGQMVSYNKTNKETKEKMPFIKIFDKNQSAFNSYFVSKMATSQGRNMEFYGDGTDELFPKTAATIQSILNLKDLSKIVHAAPANMSIEDISFYVHVLSISPYSLLTKINDTIYFFDHLNDLIAAYDLDGNYLKETSINYHNNDGWDKEIIVNEEKTRCFAKFTRNGETSLIEINPNTGQMLKKYILEEHAFPTKIRVRGNEIHYLSKDYFEGEQKYFLWRQHLE